MESFLQQLAQIEQSGTHLHLRSAMHGIEKEGLRVDSLGNLSSRPHPQGLGSPLTNSSITTDFSEALLELITPAFTAPEVAIDFLENVHRFTYDQLDDELIWVGSMPCEIEDSSHIPIAEFGSSNVGRMKHLYRVGLKHRYGSMMQSIAGIHYNFSLPDEFWIALKAHKKIKDDLQTFRSASYFNMIRNFRRHSWLLLYLFGASPALSDFFMKGKDHKLQKLHEKTLFLPYATSLRMSDLGYTTNAQSSLDICFNHLKTYIQSLTKAIHTTYPAYKKIGVKVDGVYRQLAATILQIENEYYSDIRPKRVVLAEETPLQALKKRGVEYVEVRNTDVNPFLPVGVDLQQALFFDTFLISCLFMEQKTLSPAECKGTGANLQKVTVQGRQPGLILWDLTGEIPFETAATKLVEKLEITAQMLDTLHNTSAYGLSVKTQIEKIQDSALTPSSMILQALKETGLEYSSWILEKSKEHRDTLRQVKLNAAVFDDFTQQVQDSVSKQKQLEESDQLPFDDFLKIYRTGK